MKMKSVVALLLSTLLTAGCTAAPSTGTQKPSDSTSSPIHTEKEITYQDISPEDAKKRIDNGEEIIILDVRTPEEYEEERIPRSILIPIEPEDEVSKTVETIIPDKSSTVFVYCRSGRRSLDAVKIMVGMGYKNVYNLGGIQSWPYETVTQDESVS